MFAHLHYQLETGNINSCPNIPSTSGNASLIALLELCYGTTKLFS